MSEKWLFCIAKKDDSDDVFYINHKFILYVHIYINADIFKSRRIIPKKTSLFSFFGSFDDIINKDKKIPERADNTKCSDPRVFNKKKKTHQIHNPKLRFKLLFT